MPELMNFCLLYPQAQNLPDITTCIDTLFSTCPSWFGQPKDAFFLNWETWVQYTLAWPLERPVEPHELKNAAIFTYATLNEGEGRCGNLVSVTADGSSAVYTISAVMEKVVSLPLKEVEDWIVELIAALSHFAVPVVAVGSETELDKTTDKVAAVASTTSLSTNAFWVVVDKASLPAVSTRFIEVREIGDSVLLRSDGIESLFPSKSTHSPIVVDNSREILSGGSG